jgi:hypothetical protein
MIEHRVFSSFSDAREVQELFVPVRVGETWQVLDTRSGDQVVAGPLGEVEAIELALLLTALAHDPMPNGILLN